MAGTEKMIEFVEKEFILTEETANLFVEAFAMKGLRDIYAKLPFGYKKALKCAKEMHKLKQKGWWQIYNLYPILKKHTKIQVDWDKMIIKILD